MNEIVNKFLLAGDKFLPEMHLRHLQQMFVDHLLKIQKFKEADKKKLKICLPNRTKQSLLST